MLFLASFRLCEKYLTGIFNTEGTEVYTKVAEAPHFYNQLIYQKNSLRSLPLCAFARKIHAKRLCGKSRNPDTF